MSQEPKKTIYDDLQSRLRYHSELAVRHQFRWSVLARLFQFLLPILSGILTIIAAQQSGLSNSDGGTAVFWIGGVLTLLTGLNSTLQPSKKVVFYSQYSNKFTALQTELTIELQELIDSYGVDTKEFRLKRMELMKRKNREIAGLIDAYNSEQNLPVDSKVLPPAQSS
jgi:hypothetical protein